MNSKRRLLKRDKLPNHWKFVSFHLSSILVIHQKKIKEQIILKKKKQKKKLKQKIQDNFFTIIVFLLFIFIMILIGSLFTPISVGGLPNSSFELDRYSTGIDQRTIIIRSVSYIISGISVVIAFISLMQSKTSELKRERMQVIPFPAYAIFEEGDHYSSTPTPKLTIKNKNTVEDHIFQTEFDITIKNIGLGSLVDYEIKDAYYETPKGKLKDLAVAFPTSFILGKGETIRLVISLEAGFEKEKEASLESISIVSTFKDLLGHNYTQEFTIESEFEYEGQQKITRADGTKPSTHLYSLIPKQIMHAHPYEF